MKSIKLAPVFILQDVVLPPGGILPLNIFEERYKELLQFALANNREIVVAQTTNQFEDDGLIPTNTEIYAVGGLGRIIHFEERTNGTFRITLLGRNRVMLVEQKPSPLPFALYYVDSQPFLADLTNDDFALPNKKQFMKTYRDYTQLYNITIDWDGLYMLDDSRLINILTMTSRFSPAEKQSLLEADNNYDRYNKLLMMVQMAISSKYLHTNDPVNSNQVFQ